MGTAVEAPFESDCRDRFTRLRLVNECLAALFDAQLPDVALDGEVSRRENLMEVAFRTAHGGGNAVDRQVRIVETAQDVLPDTRAQRTRQVVRSAPLRTIGMENLMNEADRRLCQEFIPVIGGKRRVGIGADE